jgi:hypothetical protein
MSNLPDTTSKLPEVRRVDYSRLQGRPPYHLAVDKVTR